MRRRTTALLHFEGLGSIVGAGCATKHHAGAGRSRGPWDSQPRLQCSIIAPKYGGLRVMFRRCMVAAEAHIYPGVWQAVGMAAGGGVGNRSRRGLLIGPGSPESIALVNHRRGHGRSSQQPGIHILYFSEDLG